MKRNGTAGFTLIELLVVIAIIGILSSVVLASLNTARAKARNAVRFSDLTQVRTALEAYYIDKGVYPSTYGSWRTVCTNGPGGGGFTATDEISFSDDPDEPDNSSAYIPWLVSGGYISRLPTDPSGCRTGGYYNGYIYRSDGVDYKFMTDASAEGTACPAGKPFNDPPRSVGASFCSVYSAGAANW